jgi:hypothetical protein
MKKKKIYKNKKILIFQQNLINEIYDKEIVRHNNYIKY